MKKKIALLTALAVAGLFLTGQTYHRPYTITSASVDCGGAGAAALAVQFKTITIRADPSNAGAVCVGGSTVTCQVGIATAATDGFKLMPGESITLGDGSWGSGTLYLYNTSANDYVTYITMD